VVCPSYAALPETTAGFAYMYPWHSDIMTHANTFANVLNDAVITELTRREKDDTVDPTLMMQKMYTDSMYNWEDRAMEWTQFLRSFGE
jgi:hypothetical protein